MTIEVTKSKIFSVLGVVLILFGILLGVIIFFRGCLTPSPSAVPTVTTIKTSDTAHNVVTGSSPQIQPIVVYSQPSPAAKIPIQYTQTSTDIKELTQTVKDLVAQLYAINHYDNNVSLKDSSGKEVGQVNLKQDVTQNKLQPFTPTYKLNIPVITNTITTTIDHPFVPRNQLYLGAGLIGTQVSLIEYFKAGAIFKNKKDLAIQASALWNLRGFGGEVGVYKLISFRKNK